MRLQAPYLVLVRYVVPVRYSNLFVDNHVPGTCLQQILPAVYTVPGIPYQVPGTEDKFTLRAANGMVASTHSYSDGRGGGLSFLSADLSGFGTSTLHFFQSHVGHIDPQGRLLRGALLLSQCIRSW